MEFLVGAATVAVGVTFGTILANLLLDLIQRK